MSRTWPSPRRVSIVAGAVAAVLLVLGSVGWLVSGRAHLAILGALAVVACGAGVVHYRWTVDLGVSTVLPEDVVRAAGFAVPILGGAVAWGATGDWRWAATGLLVGSFLPGLVDSVLYSARMDGPGGLVSAILGWTFLGLLVGPLLWLWTADVLGALPGLAIPIGIALFILLVMVRSIGR